MNDQIKTIVNIELQKLVPFRDYPFQVRDDDEMRMLTESVSSVGILVPAIVRPIEDGQYEIIAGHRRHYASGLAGLSTIPCIVRDVDRDTATVMMVDSNFQREEILPSERAKAYQNKYAMVKSRESLIVFFPNLCLDTFSLIQNVFQISALERIYQTLFGDF